MNSLDAMLDDALAGFEEDEDIATTSTPQLPCQHQQGSADEAAPSSAAATAPPGMTAAEAETKASSGLTFDPLRRKSKGSGSAAQQRQQRPQQQQQQPAARRALKPQVAQLQDDLAKLVSEWSQALHPDDDSAANSAGADGEQQPRGPSAALRALQECTRATVAEQARLAPAVAPQQSSSAAPAATGGGGGSGSEQVNMIVDVVMQHLLSKDVLYAPMKEILQLYPPWLQRQQSGALPADELARYQQQYECVRRLVDAYEEEQQDPGRIMTLLQEMQACGEPPPEIVEEMSSAIAADLPGLTGTAGAGSSGSGGTPRGLGDLDFGALDIGDLGALAEQLPADLGKGCPVQ